MTRTDLLDDLVAGLRTGRVVTWSHRSAPHYLDLLSNRLVRASAPLAEDDIETERPRLPTFPPDVLFGVVPSIAAWTSITRDRIPIYFHAGKLVVGPRLAAEPAREGCPTCVIVRLLAASPHHLALSSLWRSAEPAARSFAADHLHSRGSLLAEALPVVATRPHLGIAIGLDDGRLHRLHLPPLPGHPEHHLSAHSHEIGLTG